MSTLEVFCWALLVWKLIIGHIPVPVEPERVQDKDTGQGATEGTMTVSITVSDHFDGGNISMLKEQPNPQDPSMIDVILNIKPDPYTELEKIAHMQYFSFASTVTGLNEEGDGQSVKVQYVIDNAFQASYPEAWPGTTVCYSPTPDQVDSWKRVRDTVFKEDKLHWKHEHSTDETVYFSYFPLFSHSRHLKLVKNCSKYATECVSLGKSLDGRDIECVTAGTGTLICWIIHRQHPGEVMAEHYAEGLLNRLLGLQSGGKVDETATKALEAFTFYIVPCMCPDGAARGHLRTNAAGANLNREWADKDGYEAPTLERSPEVYHVLKKMDETGVDVFLDIHGDEELPFNFTVGPNWIPKWGPRLESLLGAFTAEYARRNKDMQVPIGYPPLESPEMVLQYMNVAFNQVANRFDCLAVTLEMPFKDCRTNPDPEYGWTAARSRKLGESVLEPLLYVAPHLRATGPFWESLPAEDKYVVTKDDYEDEAKKFVPPLVRFIRKRYYLTYSKFSKKK